MAARGWLMAVFLWLDKMPSMFHALQLRKRRSEKYVRCTQSASSMGILRSSSPSSTNPFPLTNIQPPPHHLTPCNTTSTSTYSISSNKTIPRCCLSSLSIHTYIGSQPGHQNQGWPTNAKVFILQELLLCKTPAPPTLLPISLSPSSPYLSCPVQPSANE